MQVMRNYKTKNMNRFFIILAVSLLTSCSIKENKNTIDKTKVITKNDTIDLQSTNQTSNWNDLKKYIGTYSKDTDFFRNPIVKNELEKILGKDLKDYEEHLSLSGCGEIEYKYGLLYGDVSQLHVGGFSSLFFVDITNKKMYLFWLSGTVGGKDYKIYGDKPIPANVLNLIEQEMNICWGHVARFFVKGDSIDIETKH
jgi:hypothetical protein